MEELHPCNRHILEALMLSDRLLQLAEDGEARAEDDSCRVLYGVIRDCAFTIKRQAQVERGKHQKAGRWTEDVA